MRDLQSEQAILKLGIDNVGITNLEIPLNVLFEDKKQPTIGSLDIFCSLLSSSRGAHMSRMIEIAHKYHKETLTKAILKKLIKDLQSTLENQSVSIKFRFKLFKNKLSPVRKKEGLIGYECSIKAENDQITLGTNVLVKTLCPVSQSISDYGAHNQRGNILIEAALDKNSLVWFEDLITLAEKNGSSEMYSILKREDEKYVTEKAYKNGKIVEDIVRGVASGIQKMKGITSWNISCENFESIHTHNAYAQIRGNNGRN